MEEEVENQEKLSLEVIQNFVREYFMLKESKYKNLRFGQAFLGYFYPDLSCPVLFYEESNKKAQEYILENFLRKEQ